MEDKKTVLAMFAAAAANVIWGVGVVFSRRALAVSSPALLMFWRFTAALAVMTLYAWFRGIRLRFRGRPRGANARRRRGRVNWRSIRTHRSPLIHCQAKSYKFLPLPCNTFFVGGDCGHPRRQWSAANQSPSREAWSFQKD